MNATITEKPSESDVSGRGEFKDTTFFSSESPNHQNPSTARIPATGQEIPRATDEELSVIPTSRSEFIFPRIGSISKMSTIETTNGPRIRFPVKGINILSGVSLSKINVILQSLLRFYIRLF